MHWEDVPRENFGDGSQLPAFLPFRLLAAHRAPEALETGFLLEARRAMSYQFTASGRK